MPLPSRPLVAPAAELAAVAAPAALTQDAPRADDERARGTEKRTSPASDRARSALVGDASQGFQAMARTVAVHYVAGAVAPPVGETSAARGRHPVRRGR